jgi:hypothetical protein
LPKRVFEPESRADHVEEERVKTLKKTRLKQLDELTRLRRLQYEEDQMIHYDDGE